jgi:hypothetical protein
VYTTGNAVDFLEYPQGASPGMIADVLPGEGRTTLTEQNKGEHGADYYWCLYCLPPEQTEARLKSIADILPRWGIRWNVEG